MKSKIEKIVKNASVIVLNALEHGTGIHAKEGVGNYVTDCDIAVQQYLHRELSALMPDAGFIGEEGQSRADASDGACFIVDPIDGTANFIRSLGYSAISVALLYDGEPQIGVVCNPFTGEMFSAQHGEGSYLNGKRIRSLDRPLSKSICSFGATVYQRDVTDLTFAMLRAVFDRCEDVRSFGSAALDICQIAAGRLDAFFELRLLPWDYAAGMCILREAGGRITTMEGEALPFSSESSVLAANSAIHSELLRVFQAAL